MPINYTVAPTAHWVKLSVLHERVMGFQQDPFPLQKWSVAENSSHLLRMRQTQLDLHQGRFKWNVAAPTLQNQALPDSHRIIERLRLEKALQITKSQFPALDRGASHQIRLPRALSNLALKTSRDGPSITIVVSIFLGLRWLLGRTT